MLKIKVVSLVAVALVAAATVCGGAEGTGTGFGLGPGLVLAENIKPGEEVDLSKAMGAPFVVYNGTDAEHEFHAFVAKPSTAISDWEYGYDEIPDASWCHLDQKDFKIDKKSDAKVKLFIKVPDKPENYNRKFMVLVIATPSAGGGPGVVGLQVASRVQIETSSKDAMDGAGTGPISIVPSCIDLPGLSADFTAKQFVMVRNNTKEERTYTVKHLNDLEKDAAKFSRYFGVGRIPVVTPAWASAGEDTFKLKPDETKKLLVSWAVPKTALTGKNYEELLFVQDDKGHNQFVRLRTEIAGAESAGK